MSHYKIIVKVKADSEEDAIDLVQSELEETTTDGNRAGFDYVSDDMKVLTEKDHSFEQLEDEWGEKSRQEDIGAYLEMIRENIRISLAQKHLPLKDIPPLMKSEDERFNNLLEERLKSDEDYELPKNFTELLDVVMESISSLGTDEEGSSNLYMLRQIQELMECQRYKERYYLLNTLNNHFADLTEDTEGENVYYVIADRHA